MLRRKIKEGILIVIICSLAPFALLGVWALRGIAEIVDWRRNVKKEKAP